MNRNRPFLIYTPPYWSGSHGIFALHRLADNLCKLGFQASLKFYNLARNPLREEILLSKSDFLYNPEDKYNLAFRNQFKEFLSDTDDYIVVYPETLPGNPLGAKNVVRYVMNFPDKNLYKMVAGERDFILTFWHEYFPNADCQLAILPNDSGYFFNNRVTPFEQRRCDVTYVGKGVKLPQFFDIKGTQSITREWPVTKTHLYDLLRRVRFFFTWDPISALNTEAVLCGALPIYLRFQPYFKDKADFDRCVASGRIPYGTAIPLIEERSYKNLEFHFNEYFIERQRFINNLAQIRSSELFSTMAFAEKAQAHFLH